MMESSPTFLMIRRKVLEKILSDPWWSKELEAARTMRQQIEVIMAYGQAEGFKVKRVILS